MVTQKCIWIVSSHQSTHSHSRYISGLESRSEEAKKQIYFDFSL